MSRSVSLLRGGTPCQVLYDPTSDLYRFCSLIIVIGQEVGNVLGVLMARKLLQQGVSRFQTW